MVLLVLPSRTFMVGLRASEAHTMKWPSDVIGGEKEEATRRMILAGKAWLDAHPGSVPEFKLFGAEMRPMNSAAIGLLNAITEAAPTFFDEAMQQTAINHCSFIRHHGWSKYLESLTPVKHACTCSGLPPYNINCMSHGHLVPRKNFFS